MSGNSQPVARLALRVEGCWWVAYGARPDTMDEALEIGRIRMTIVMMDEERRSAFMDLMSAALGDLVHDVTGQRPDRFEISGAPEHERAGRT